MSGVDAIASTPQVAMLALAGLAAGLWLLARGFRGYRVATRIGDMGTSRIASMAAGEVRIAGTIEPAELTLVSPLQSRPCVYYKAEIQNDDDGRIGDELHEEQAVGFVVRDDSGSIRVFPRGAHWDAPITFDEKTDAFGDEPPGLDRRRGSAIAGPELDRKAAIAALLTVQPPEDTLDDDVHPLLRGSFGIGGSGRGRRRYREWRLAPGDKVTILGRAMPFSDLADPAEADIAADLPLAHDDPEIVGDIAEARAAGLLADDPEEAWGNAAIPGFGIGKPIRAPELDPAATRPALADVATAERVERIFTIAPTALVLASAPDVPLLIAHGVPGAATERHQDRFIVGLGGAVLAIASAVVLAIWLGSGTAT